MTEFNSEATESSADDIDVADAVEANFSSHDDHDFIDVLTHVDSSEEDDEFVDDDDDDEFVEAGEEPVIGNGEPSVVMMSLPVTGEPRVDDAIARLSDLSSLPVDEHVAVFEDVQRRLHDTLADLSGQ